MSDFFFGPAFPAPGGGSISSSGETGEAGGQTRTYSELDFAAYDHIWWGLSGIGAAMDGAIDMASETFSLTSISGDGLIAIWSGTTSVSGAGYSGLVYEQLTVAINLGLSGSVSWSSATPLAFPAGSPAAVAELSALAGQLVVNLAFSASTTGAEGSYIPFFDFYENAHSFVASQEVRSSSERFITQIANQLPAGISGTISTDEDVSRPFTLSDFGFLDGNGRDSLKSVRIDTIPASGALTLNSENVAVGDEISATDIANGFLAFTPAGNACGLAYASFDFSVFDSLEFSISPATLTIDVTPVNDSPTEINLSASSLDENNLPTASVATLAAASPDAAGEFTFKLVSGEGSTDNAAFTISGDQLQINAVADFETKSNYDIRLRVTGLGDLWFETVKTITVNDLNEAPAAVTLSAFSLDENNAAGATVATLQAVDPDAGDSFTFVLFSDDGPDDNAAFTVSGDQLQIIGVADFETKSSYDIRLRVTDAGGMWVETIKTITVIDANDAPVDIQLSAFSLDENNAAGATVATLTANDPGSVLNFTFVLVSGDRSDDNAAFTISGDQLQIIGVADFETKSSYDIRVRVTDAGGMWVETTKTINVNDANEAPFDIQLSASKLDENNDAGVSVATLTANDPDAGDTFTFALADGNGSTDNATFSITSGDQLQINTSTDFEAKSSYDIRLRITDARGLWVETTETIEINDVNESPAAVALTAFTLSLAENASTATPIKIADIVLTDDAFGSEIFVLTGADATLFEIAGTGLFLKAGTVLDFETKSAYQVAVSVDDPLVGKTPDATSATYVLRVSNVSPEILTGTGAADTLTGGGDIDQIFGFTGNDTLSGGGGNDLLDGGLGRDVMTGGSGADYFDFNLKTDSGRTSATRDLITDFTPGLDRIDLSTIDAKKGGGNQAFHFINKQGFHHKTGELHYKFSGSGTLVEGDIDGNGKADFQIELAGRLHLSKTDFIL